MNIKHFIDRENGSIQMYEEDGRLLAQLSMQGDGDYHLHLYPDDAEYVDTALRLIEGAIYPQTKVTERDDNMDSDRLNNMLAVVLNTLSHSDGVSARHELDSGGDNLWITVEQKISDTQIAKANYHFILKSAGIDYEKVT
jgi:hypothetical protein